MAIAFTRRPSVRPSLSLSSLSKSTIVEVFETRIYYSCSPAILQAYQGWYFTLPQYVSENSGEPLDFGETLKLKNEPFSYILRELCGSF